ncbi:MAG: amino acid ABC transporter ATP-binding protein [Ilumatobacteraceae bacterium]
MSFLDIQNVSKSFGDTQVLNGLSLSVERHEVVCLIGPSGCGKSTLLRCINRLEEIDGGAIHLEGEEITGPGVNLNRARRHIGMVFQAYNLFPHMTALKNVMLGPRRVLGVSKAEAEDRARKLLDRFGLAAQAHQYPDSLSGGQKQRVAIVRALAMDAELLLLDEVTSALDPELVCEVLALLTELAGEGRTLVLATHELGFARSVADKVCFVHQGVVFEQGPPSAVLDDPSSERLRSFTAGLRAGTGSAA